MCLKFNVNSKMHSLNVFKFVGKICPIFVEFQVFTFPNMIKYNLRFGSIFLSKAIGNATIFLFEML
jgi:hypothetical protein